MQRNSKNLFRCASRFSRVGIARVAHARALNTVSLALWCAMERVKRALQRCFLPLLCVPVLACATLLCALLLCAVREPEA